MTNVTGRVAGMRHRSVMGRDLVWLSLSFLAIVGCGGGGSPSDAAVDVAFDSGSSACSVATLFFTGPIPQMVDLDNVDPPDLGCVGTSASGPDKTYELIASLGAGTYRVTVTPFVDTLDPMIYVLPSCGAMNCLAGTMLNGPGEPESVELELSADQVVYVVVDTEPASSGGAFRMEAQKL